MKTPHDNPPAPFDPIRTTRAEEFVDLDFDAPEDADITLTEFILKIDQARSEDADW